MPKKILFALLLMGFTSLAVQTLLIREFLISFYGNELSIGLILANWIILEASGSGLASRYSLKSRRPCLIYALLQTGIALYLPLSILLIRNIKNILGLTLGEGIGILPIFFSSFLILLPLSLFDGAQFPFGCRILTEAKAEPLKSTGRVYILEAMGFILAGPIFTYILITRFNSFSIAFCLGLLNLSSAIFLLKGKLLDALNKTFFIIITILFFLAALAFLGPAERLHKLSINKQWRGQRILSYRNSIYNNLAVSESANQYTFYSGGIPIITTPVPDITCIEELAHFTMLAHPNPKNVLLLSGGSGGLIKEALKYPVDKLTYTELDPLLIKMVKDFPTDLTRSELSDPRLEIKYVDGRRFIRMKESSRLIAAASGGRYDIIILNLPMPSTLQLNRFYTREFFQDIKSVLSEDGIFSFSLPGSLSYLNPQMRSLNGAVLNTLKDIFYVNIIPGDFNLYLASKNKFLISPEIYLSRLKDKNIQTKLLDKFHLEYRLHPRWLTWFKGSLSDYTKIRKNLDLLPSGTFYSIAYWNSIFSPRFQGLLETLDKLNFRIIFAGLLLSGLALCIIKAFLAKSKRLSISFAICTTGFVGMGFNLMIIYAYQSFYGLVFSHLAILITAFMAGLTLGGWLMTKRLLNLKNDILTFSKIEMGIIGFYIIAGPLLLCVNTFPSSLWPGIFFLLSGFSGYLIGSEFPLANKIYCADRTFTKSAGILYALDLLGAWAAALLVSVALVPVIGILKTFILLVLIKIISLIMVKLEAFPTL